MNHNWAESFINEGLQVKGYDTAISATGPCPDTTTCLLCSASSFLNGEWDKTIWSAWIWNERELFLISNSGALSGPDYMGVFNTVDNSRIDFARVWVFQPLGILFCWMLFVEMMHNGLMHTSKAIWPWGRNKISII